MSEVELSRVAKRALCEQAFADPSYQGERPAADLPMLLPYQIRWVLDRSPFKVGEKSRRVGFTWATAYEAVEVASMRAADGGCNVWYQTYAEDDAKEFISDCAKWARACSSAFEVVEETIDGDEARDMYLLADGEHSIKITSIRFKSGFRVTALAHSPRKLRGKGGLYILDEAAFHEDMAGAMKAAFAFQVWGGRIIILSTHNGVECPFNKLVEDIRSGDEKASLHSVTLLDACAEGLYKRICLVTNEVWSEERETAWIADLMKTPGAQEEFMCVPARSAGVYIPRPLIERAMHDDMKVVRWRTEDSFLFEQDQIATVDAWLAVNVAPLLADLDKTAPHYLGVDFGRVRDGSVFAVATPRPKQGYLAVPVMIELWNMPYEAQKHVYDYITKRVPRFSFAALDATGNGAALGEHALVRHGELLVEPVKMSNVWYADALPHLKTVFESGEIRIPNCVDIRNDVGMFTVIDGIPKLPKLHAGAARVNAIKGEKRHGDGGVAIALAVYASRRPPLATSGYRPVAKGGKWARKDKGIW